jgi:predicted regulator of Ras-like GTPase activity (Roadblock/LC7/MglB family)
MTPRLTLAMEPDGPSRGRYVRDVVQQLLRLGSIRGALLVATDGLVIAAEVPDATAVEPLGAMAARVGRDLEASAARLGRASFSTAMLSAADDVMFVAASPIGYVVVLAEHRANLDAIRRSVEEAVGLIELACAPAEGADDP